MNRSLARFLLLVVLVGNLGPLLLAATAQPHACCVRKPLHRCHDFPASEAEKILIRDASCCDHSCGRAVVTALWAHTQTRGYAWLALNVDRFLIPSRPTLRRTADLSVRSPRAPPHSSIA
jgi:hypothetical protein